MRVSPRVLGEGALMGAVAGGGAGAAAGQIAGGNTGKAAGIGAAVGALAGLLYALHVESSYSDAQCQEAALDAAIALLRDANRSTEELNGNLAAYAADLTVRVADARAHKRGRREKLRQLRAEKIQILNGQIVMSQLDTQASQLVSLMRKAPRPSPAIAAALDTEIAHTEAQILALRRNQEALASLSARM